MKNFILTILLPILLFSLSGVALHKYHAALYQIKYAPEKKMIQITTRIHIDDLRKALEKKYKKSFSFENDNENTEELKVLKDYLSNHFSIKVNNQSKTMNLITKEVDGDELICYLNIKEISKINSLEIYNTILTELFQDQQNMVNVAILGTKNSFLLTSKIPSKMITYKF